MRVKTPAGSTSSRFSARRAMVARVARGKGRAERDAVLEDIGDRDPELHAELVALRSVSPQAYRRRLAAWADDRGLPTGRLRQAPPTLGVAPRTAGALMARLAGANADTGPDASPDAAVVELLTGTVGDLRAALATGDWDSRLDAIAAAEAAGRDRRGVLDAVAARRERG